LSCLFSFKELHPAIKGVYDVKATYIGPDVVRLKAEIDIDGAVIGSAYLSKLDGGVAYNEFVAAGEAKLPFKVKILTIILIS
jgi:hypothetical protein